jgi:hypothetical protein
VKKNNRYNDFMNEINNAYQLIQNIVDAQEDLLILFQGEQPFLMNQAALDFFAVSSFSQYQEQFGAFSNNFVPHPSYFNMHKVNEGESWIAALAALDEKDKIVSMVNRSHEPRAFGVSVNTEHDEYTVLTLKDISANLIKCIMIENDVSMDKHSGAYNKEYFLHTSEILKDGAAYNEKEIGLTMMRLDVDNKDAFTQVVSKIKEGIRQNDMLVKWSSNTLLLAYMVDQADNAMVLSQKLSSIISQERSSGMNFNLAVTLVKDNEKITGAISRLNQSLEEEGMNKLKLI